MPVSLNKSLRFGSMALRNSAVALCLLALAAGAGAWGRHAGHDQEGMGGWAMMLDDSMIERHAGRMLKKLDASAEQKKQVLDTLKKAAAQARPLQQQMLELRRQLRTELLRDKLNRAALEALVTQMQTLQGQITPLLHGALLDSLALLDAHQRQGFIEQTRHFWPQADKPANSKASDNKSTEPPQTGKATGQ